MRLHQESFGNDLRSDYCDIIRDASFGNKDSKLGPTLNPKQVREKKKKPTCKDNCTEKVHHESFGNRDSKIGPGPTPKEVRKKEKKTRCKDKYFETIYPRVLATRALGTRTTNVDRLSKKEIRQKGKGDKAVRFEA